MFKNKDIPHLDWLPIIIISFIFFKLINNIGSIGSFIASFFSIIGSFIWAFAIAYLLNPIMRYLETKFKLKRNLSLAITYIIVIGFIALAITNVVPKIAKSTSDLVSNIPTYFEKTQKWLNSNTDTIDLINEKMNIDIEKSLNNFLSKAGKVITSNFNTAFMKAVNVTSEIFKCILGFIIAIYILKDKEKFKLQLKKFLYASMKESRVDKIINITRQINFIFYKYIIGKAVDSLIIGILCFIGLAILRTPYALLLSFIVGFTNMIPYFGPFIGMIPAVILTLFYSPIKALWVLIFIVLLQQFDGWYLGPKILGSQVGLSPFWIILAIVIGGGVSGVLGMFLAVPVFATIKLFLDEFMSDRLKRKNINLTKK